MSYIVIHKFKDLEDNNHIYKVGDIYPREGINPEDVKEKRIKMLTTKKNKIGEILIQENAEEENNTENDKNSEEESDKNVGEENNTTEK